jgi:hypothetical protein
LGNSRLRVVARICLALLALFFVVAIGLYVVLPRVFGEDVARVHLSGAAIFALWSEDWVWHKICVVGRHAEARLPPQAPLLSQPRL